jgi:septal ring factor EnvC (AmiA/AmiB activator)
MDENTNDAPAKARGRYKIKEELRNQDIKIGGVLYEKVIFNRDSETLSKMLKSNDKLVSYLIADEEIDNKETISSLNKEADVLLEKINKLEKENKEWDARLKSAYNEMDKMKKEIEMLRKRKGEKEAEKVVINDEGMGNPL